MGSQALRSRAGRRVARARPRRGRPRPLRRGGGGRGAARVRRARRGAVGGAQDHPRNLPRSGRYGGEGRRARRRLDSGPHALRRVPGGRSEEHTSELQSRRDLVCRLLLEKKKKKKKKSYKTKII